MIRPRWRSPILLGSVITVNQPKPTFRRLPMIHSTVVQRVPSTHEASTSHLPWLPFSVSGHWLYATSEACFTNSMHNIFLGTFKQTDDFGEGRTHVGVSIPAARHDLAECREAILWYNWSYSPVHNSKCCLNSCHILKWKHPCYKLPENYAKAINVNLLIVRSVLDHLSENKKVWSTDKFSSKQLCASTKRNKKNETN